MRLLMMSLLLLLPSCAAAPPTTHYYRLVVRAAPQALATRGARCAVLIEPPTVDATYDTERMVYSKSPYRIDYYHYHLWSVTPSLQVADYLREAYGRTAAFRVLATSPPGQTGTRLRGRLLAFEEVDVTHHDWVGRIKLGRRLLGPPRWPRHARRPADSGPMRRAAPLVTGRPSPRGAGTSWHSNCSWCLEVSHANHRRHKFLGCWSLGFELSAQRTRAARTGGRHCPRRRAGH